MIRCPIRGCDVVVVARRMSPFVLLDHHIRRRHADVVVESDKVMTLEGQREKAAVERGSQASAEVYGVSTEGDVLAEMDRLFGV